MTILNTDAEIDYCQYALWTKLEFYYDGKSIKYFRWGDFKHIILPHYEFRWNILYAAIV